MFRKRYRQQIPELNTTSTADISFMLLIFFLVTSSMDTEKGLLRQMAPPPQEQTEPKDVNKDHVLQVELDGHDQLTCNGKTVDYRALAEEVRTMATINREGHIITIKTDSETSYEAYFGMQNAIAGAYASLRQDYALKHFGKRYADCDAEQRALLNEYYPQRISEDLKGGDQ
jgi:biopolymer transport protein ExbD